MIWPLQQQPSDNKTIICLLCKNIVKQVGLSQSQSVWSCVVIINPIMTMTRKSSYSAHKLHYNILYLTSSEPNPIQSPLYLGAQCCPVLHCAALYMANIIIADPVFVSKVHQRVIAIAVHKLQ